MDKENKRDAPVLIELDEAAVTDWVKQYEAYVKRGGSRRPRDCIDADVLAAAKLFGVDVKSQGGTVEELAADDGRFLNELRAIYAAPNEDSARAVLSAISLGSDFTVDAVCKFVLKFTKATTQHATAVAKLGEKTVRGIFLDGVEPEVMRKRVKASSQASWEAAAEDLMRRAREHEVKVKEVALLSGVPRADKKANAKLKLSVPAGGDDGVETSGK